MDVRMFLCLILFVMTANPTKRTENSFVIDASVAVKWFSQEIGSVVARDILKSAEMGKTRLFAPDILLYEVGNALWKGKKIEGAKIKKTLLFLRNSVLEFFPLDEAQIEWGVTFMEKYNLTFYDAAYAALSYEWNAPLISANPKDHEKIQEVRTIQLVKFR